MGAPVSGKAAKRNRIAPGDAQQKGTEALASVPFALPGVIDQRVRGFNPAGRMVGPP